MRNCLAAVLLFLCLSVLLTGGVSAVGEMLETYRGTPAIDGVMDDVWETAHSESFAYCVDGEKRVKGKLPSTSDGVVYSLWDDSAIYFLIQLTDDDFSFRTGGAHDNDCLYFYADEADWFDSTWRNGQLQLAIVPADGARVQVLHGKLGEGSEIAFSAPKDNVRIIEIKYVPKDFTIRDGARLLVDFRFSDITPDGALAYSLTWSDQLNEGELDSSNWSYLELRTGGASGSAHKTAEDAARSIGMPIIKNVKYVSGTEGYGSEGSANLFDGDVGTKFCTAEFPAKSVAKLDSNYNITGVIMATANDNESYNGRNPNDWKIQGSIDGENWETILEGDESFFQEKNFTYYALAIEPTAKPYSYIRFRNASTVSGVMQISELVVCGVKKSDKAALDALMNPVKAEPVPRESVKLLPIAAASEPVFPNEAVAQPEPVPASAPVMNSYTLSLITFAGLTVFLLALCMAIVLIQKRRGIG